MNYLSVFHQHTCTRWLMPILALVMLALSFTHLPVAHAAEFNPGCKNGVGKAAQLQNVIATANTNGAADTITLVSGCTYTLTETLTVMADGGKALTINGNGATLSGNNKVRVFYVDDGATLNLNAVKVKNGNAVALAGGGIYLYNSTVTLTNSIVSDNMAATYGGGIYLYNSTMTLTNSTVSGNMASVWGGGIYTSGGDLTLVNSTLSSNTATDDGGGILVYKSTVTLTNSTVADNTASSFGGGIYNTSSTVILTNSTVSDNTASSYGGGIYNEDTLTLTNSTVSGNTGSINGGGIHSSGTLTLVNVTLTDNSSNSGGAVHNFSGTLNLTRSILANSPSGGNCSSSGTINAAGVNLIEADANNACEVAGAITTDPKLGQPVGSPAYFPLLTGSPAIDAGGQGDCPPQDQRGAVRPQDGDGDGLAACDLGAFEKLATTGVPLLKNGGFEAKSAGHPLLSPWTLKQATGDGIVCNGASAGKCALLLTGGQGEKAVLAQNIKPGNRVFNPGDQLRLTLMVKGAAATRGKITLRVKYADNTPVQKVTIPLGRTYGGYEERFAELYLTSGAVSQITLQVSHTSPKGKTYLDAISLRHRGALMLNAPLLDVPAAQMRQPAVTLP